MATLSQYWFDDRFFGGQFGVYNVAHDGWAWISNTGGSAATLVWDRPDSEETVDLAPLLNTSDVTSQIDSLLGKAQRTSNIMAQGVFWPNVPYYSQAPGSHADQDMLVRVYFNFHIETPWYCSNADGNISYYLFFYLDQNGHLQGYVDGWSYDYDGGDPFCTGTIDGDLDKNVSSGAATVQTLLSARLALFGRDVFSKLYYLPGSGTKVSGFTSENADTDVALGLLP